MQVLLSENSLDGFYKCVNQNLEDMNNNDVFMYGLCYEQNLIYKSSIDENGKRYYILKDDFNFERAKEKYIGIVPLDFVLAAKMPNALDKLGLTMLNGKIKVKQKNKNKSINNDNEMYKKSPVLIKKIKRLHNEVFFHDIIK